MTEHPITPPPELFADWLAEGKRLHPNESLGFISRRIAQLAYQAGADMELEACISWIRDRPCTWTAEQLRTARRPKPPSLKEQALVALKRQSTRSVPSLVATEDCDIIRRALEALPDD